MCDPGMDTSVHPGTCCTLPVPHKRNQPGNLTISSAHQAVGHDERKLLWAPDLHVVNQKGKPQIHSELMRMYVTELTQTLALALT